MLPSQVSPPQIALSDLAPNGILGAVAIALPVFPADEDPDAAGAGSAGAGSTGSGPEGARVVLGPGAADLLDEMDLDLFGSLDLAKATGKAGEVTVHPVLDATGLRNESLRQVLLVGVGDSSPAALRKAGAALARRVRDLDTVATTLAALSDDDGVRALVEGLVLGSFGFHRRSTGAPWAPVQRIVLAGIADAVERQPVLETALALAGASWQARTLALVPSNEKNPPWLADRAAEVAASSGLKIRIWDEHDLERDGFGGLIGVGQASATPPRFVRLDYTPRRAGRNTPHIVLAGKGITFDSGGLSLKPADGMMTMKRDMTGAAVVLAVMGALRDVGCEVRVTGLLACAENAVSGNALRPGDVLRHYGGRTTEVTNTDAEGRLVLGDAIAYAVKELAPDAIVDIATLTGAVKVALGLNTGGLFATDDALAQALVDAGAEAGEPLWRLPLAMDYDELLESEVADSDNAPGGPGAVTAALFLQHFVGDVPWAHLDIASVGDSPVDAFEYTAGATGFGARALLRWLESADPLAGVTR